MNQGAIRAVIVDDEQRSRNILSEIIRRYGETIEVVGSADNLDQAYDKIELIRPDLVFLDIVLPDGLAFDLLNRFTEIFFRIIFITGHNEYAVKAFRYCAADYLMKPVKMEEVHQAIRKVQTDLLNRTDHRNIRELMSYVNSRSDRFDRLVIPTVKGFTVLPISDIIACRADGNYSRFFSAGNREDIASRNLGHFEELLIPFRFFKISRSCLVNLGCVSEFCRSDRTVTLTGNIEESISENKLDAFLEQFNMPRKKRRG
ncbi:MAG: response regulator transcription factor [Bacteroidales bacterium]|nr:response regulator transcription factor [Bacteroidales bacterium]